MSDTVTLIICSAAVIFLGAVFIDEPLNMAIIIVMGIVVMVGWKLSRGKKGAPDPAPRRPVLPAGTPAAPAPRPSQRSATSAGSIGIAVSVGAVCVTGIVFVDQPLNMIIVALAAMFLAWWFASRRRAAAA